MACSRIRIRGVQLGYLYPIETSDRRRVYLTLIFKVKGGWFWQYAPDLVVRQMGRVVVADPYIREVRENIRDAEQGRLYRYKTQRDAYMAAKEFYDNNPDD